MPLDLSEFFCGENSFLLAFCLDHLAFLLCGLDLPIARNLHFNKTIYTQLNSPQNN